MTNLIRLGTDFPPQGPLPQEDGGVLFRTWAPEHEAVTLVIWAGGSRSEIAMEAEAFGHWACRWDGACDGLRYAYQLGGGTPYPDPASRRQPEGVHRPSAFFHPERFPWQDQHWRGIDRRDLVFYELHVGTFTEEGTFDAMVLRLPELADLGITALELMPVAQFAGGRNWGYDGVYPYAVQHSYGGPEGLQRLVDAAHRAGLAVILDVVYNHFGPEGNYFSCFGPYYSDRYLMPWGKAINYDGPGSDAVRQFVLDNARMWIRDFHLDGLRLDAVHAIFDQSPTHILADIHTAVQAEARPLDRTVHVIAESDQSDVRLLRPADQGGYHLDGVWSDDFHHCVHTLLTGEREGYYLDFGRPEHLQKAFEKVFVYDGCYSVFRRRRHGTPVGDLDRTRFVVCIQNHDQVGNRAQGDRFGTLLPIAAQRLAAGLLLLSPCLPLLFMGEEYGERRPFPFFCSFSEPELIEAVRRGRREEFAQLAFRWGTGVPDSQSEATFRSAVLTWEFSVDPGQAGLRRLYRDLLTARRRWPPLCDRQNTRARPISPAGTPTEESASTLLLVERGEGKSLLACANLGGTTAPLPALPLENRELLLSTEEARYGGSRRREQSNQGLLPYELLIFGLKQWQQ